MPPNQSPPSRRRYQTELFMKNDRYRKLYLSLRHRKAFTLVEVVVSVLILVILLGGVMIAYQRTSDNVMVHNLRERAGAVAQRRIEFLLASHQEPNSHELHGRDEIDPIFNWRMNLQRETIPSNRSNRMSESFIKATVIVEAELPETANKPLVEMVRLFGRLAPLPGQDVAVPFEREEQTPPWYEELKQQLGREPTLDEMLGVLMNKGELSQEELDILQEPNESEAP
jgi:prepilin-type N-terminal cleavage/methylation domain-containing protein